LVGCGYWGSILRRYVEENEFFELVCVADSKTDLNVVWGNREVEAVVVATPIETHYSIVKAALLAGKHVFCEKPLALKVEECNELKKISKSCGLVLHTDYVFTFSRGLRFIQEVIGAAEVGELLACELNVKHLGRFGRQDVFWLLGSHMLSVLDMFCPLKLLDFCFVEFVKNETGAIFFDGKVKGVINVSLNFPFKEVKVVFYCQNATLVYDSVASESVK
jgi:predicted dehydrogenase